MAETWNKKEREKKKQQAKKEKAEKKLERKEHAKSSSLDDMLAYIDEDGNLSSTPPDPKKIKQIRLEDIETGVPRQQEADPADFIRTGTVTHFNESKGYGFIRDNETKESIFVHINSLTAPIQEGDKVNFEVEMGPKGPNAHKVTPAV